MATDQQFCLRWNNHQSTLISVFDSLLENGTLVDCTLAAEGQSLKAHKVVLSACSPYLEALLSQHYEKHPIVILKDVKFSELKSMMDYMYRGEVNISQDQLGTFLKAAESLQIKGLSDNGDDARDVGSTNKKPDAPRPNVTQTRAPLESKRPAPLGDVSDTSRDGSISPSSLRKRRRTRRPSNGEDPENNLDNNVCDLPAAQSTPMPVPSAPVQSLPKQIVKTEPPPPMPDPVKKEILDPPAEPLLEPKTEYLDYMNNENSIEVEDLTLDDDDEDGMDSSMDASRPGPSHGDLSQGGYPPWTMTGDQSGTDEIFMAAQEAVGAASGQQQRDSQEICIKEEEHDIAFVNVKMESDESFVDNLKVTNICSLTNDSNPSTANTDEDPNEKELNIVLKLNEIVRNIFTNDESVVSLVANERNQWNQWEKRVKCKNCIDKYHPKFDFMHTKYFCKKTLEELGLTRIGPGNVFQCIRCEELRKKDRSRMSVFYENYNLAMFHTRYLCNFDGDGMTHVCCFICQRTVKTKEFLRHAMIHGTNVEDVMSFIEVILSEIIKY